MNRNIHPVSSVRRLSCDTLVRIADKLSGMLNLKAIDPAIILSGNGTTELTGKDGNLQVAWIRPDSICYLRNMDFGLRYAYATREAAKRDRQFAVSFRNAYHISLPDVIVDAANEVIREIGNADYWVAPAFRDLLKEAELYSIYHT